VSTATTEANLHAVLDAARRLLAAREDGMVTGQEWDALREAVEACETDAPRPAPRDANSRTE
jgi:hypothetical protein